MTSKLADQLASFPMLKELFHHGDGKIADAMRLIKVQEGQSLFRYGDDCRDFLLILEGAVCVQHLSGNGQVITLYHLQPGQACELTLSCLLGGRCYPAEAIAETDVHALALPGRQFHEAMVVSPRFRQFVFTTIDRGVHSLLALVEDLSFGHLDQRLARCLLKAAGSQSSVYITHSSLAEELGTAREVVSRMLKDFEKRGWLSLHRGRIEIDDLKSLKKQSISESV